MRNVWHRGKHSTSCKLIPSRLLWRPRTDRERPTVPLPSFCSPSGKMTKDDRSIKISQVLAAAAGARTTLDLRSQGHPLPEILQALKSAQGSTTFTCIVLKPHEGEASTDFEVSCQRASTFYAPSADVYPPKSGFRCFFFDELRGSFSEQKKGGIIEAADAVASSRKRRL